MKLVSLNIEGDTHLDLVVPFLQQQWADAVCLQEVMKDTVAVFARALSMEATYVPMKKNTGGGMKGIATFTNHPITGTSVAYYSGDKDHLPTTPAGEKKNPYANNHMLLSTTIEKDGVSFTVATTHFTWSPAGQATERQRSDMKKMLDIVSTMKEFVLCGDFNAPRGREIWSLLAGRYIDHIPANITTTIDPHLHRVKNLQYVVDGIFTTPNYTVEDVRVISGVSDHQAIIASITQR